MPAFHGIRTRLESQYDCQRLEEYSSRSSDHSRNGAQQDTERFSATSELPMSNDEHEDPLSRPELIEVQVPIYANSQFWLSYEISSQSPVLATFTSESREKSKSTDVKIKYIYFKLLFPTPPATCFKDTQCDDRTISWGVGAREEWKGKTVFGLFQGPANWGGTRAIDKRGFWFPQDARKEGFFDVQIFRARARRRVSRVFPEMTANKREGGQIELIRTGRLKGYHPQKFYQYALVDAVKRPYVTFRYHLRSVEVLNEMGFHLPVLMGSGPRTYAATAEEVEKVIEGHGRKGGSTPADINAARVVNVDHSSSHEGPRSFLTSIDPAPARDYPPPRRRLSVPPSIRLVSTSSFTEPHSPAKTDMAKASAEPPFQPLSEYLADDADSNISDNLVIRRTDAGPFGHSEDEESGMDSTRNGSNFGKQCTGEKDEEEESIDGKEIGREEKATTQGVEADTTLPSLRRKSPASFLMGVLESALRRNGSNGERVRTKEIVDGTAGGKDEAIQEEEEVEKYAVTRQSL